MNLKVITENLLKISSSFTREQGKVLAKESTVKDLKGKSINGIYHIYGGVLKENKSGTYSTHIKVDIKTDRIIDSSCACKTFEENRKEIRNYVCKHIVATSYAFYNVAKKKLEDKKDKVEDEKKRRNIESKRFLSVDLSIKCIKNQGILSFQCEFRIGTGSTHLIVDIKEFIDKNNLKKSIKFNESFIFNPERDEFLKEDKDIIKFIINNREKAHGKYIRLYENEIREFLGLVNKNKKIIFNYESINYEVKVKEDNIPVALTIKSDNKDFILKHHKKFPILLSNKGDVMFFDRNLYLPKEKQLNSYLPIYKKLIRNSEVRYSKSLESLNDLLIHLKDITNNIVLDENTRDFQLRLVKPNFYFYKEEGKIYCNVRLNHCGCIIDLIKDKSNKSFLRDYRKEELIDMELEKFKFIKKEKDFMFMGDDEDIYELLKNGISKLKGIGVVNLSKDLNIFKIINSSSIISELSEFENFYKLKYSIEDFTVTELRKSIDSMKKGEGFYKNNHSYLDLEDVGVTEFLNLIEDLGLDKIEDNEINIDKNKVLYLKEKLKDRNLPFIKGSKIFEGIIKKLIDKEFKSKEVPKDLDATLRNYQILGFNWLNEITDLGLGGILADDMGLGKTIQIIAFILSQKKRKSLVVTPTSVIYNWKDEFERFAPTLKVGLIHGSKNIREKVLNNYKDYDVLLTTYGTLKNDEVKYKDINFDYCIIDEAQNIKNPTAQGTVSVKKIRSKCNIALTGTPIENNLIELWSIFDFVMPGYLFTKERFKERFIYSENITELKSLISPFILRRLKEEVLNELPSKIEKKYLVEMNGKQKKIYKSYVKEIKDKIDYSKNKITLFAYLTKLRELCLDPSLVIPEYTGGSGKLNVVKELVNESIDVGKKILLFSQFTSVLRKIEEDFSSEGINYLYLDGSTAAKERVERVKRFNEDKEIKVFLISLKAGGTGLNLTSASVVIHFDPWWNPAIEDQATDRAHRFGQKNTVEVIKLVAKDTIEEKIVLLQEEKKELIQSLMDGKAMDEGGLKRLSEEEIMKLFD